MPLTIASTRPISAVLRLWQMPQASLRYNGRLMLGVIRRRKMDTLEAVEQKLQEVRSMLDDVASDLVTSDIPCKSADIEHIGEALVSISSIQLSIYEQRPDLKPEYLDNISKDVAENREFGRILIQNERHLSQNKPNDAIGLLNDFRAKKPHQEFMEMANSEISRIKQLFGV